MSKLKNVAVDIVNRDAMKVRWRLDCSDRVGIVTGYKVSYCPIASDLDTADCINGEQFSEVTGPAQEQVWINGLKPWTYYKVIKKRNFLLWES